MGLVQRGQEGREFLALVDGCDRRFLRESSEPCSLGGSKHDSFVLLPPSCDLARGHVPTPALHLVLGLRLQVLLWAALATQADHE